MTWANTNPTNRQQGQAQPLGGLQQAALTRSPLISTASVTGLVKLTQKRPVWLLTAADDSQWVIKGEMAQGRSQDALNFAFDLMNKAGGKGAKTRTLTDKEKTILFGLGANQDLDPNECAELLRHNVPLFTWLLMEYVGNLTNMEDVADNNDAKASLDLLIALEKPANLERLGRIIAIDLFLGNGDRFNPNEGSNAIQNSGNVFFKKGKDGVYSIRGLDPIDPNCSWSKLDQDVLQLEGSKKKEEWTGKKLADNNFLKEYAFRILGAIIQELKGRIDPTEANKHMFVMGVKGKGGHGGTTETSHVKKVVKGMKLAREDIKLICQARMANLGGRHKAPDGLESRMKVLKWTK